MICFAKNGVILSDLGHQTFLKYDHQKYLTRRGTTHNAKTLMIHERMRSLAKPCHTYHTQKHITYDNNMIFYNNNGNYAKTMNNKTILHSKIKPPMEFHLLLDLPGSPPVAGCDPPLRRLPATSLDESARHLRNSPSREFPQKKMLRAGKGP